MLTPLSTQQQSMATRPVLDSPMSFVVPSNCRKLCLGSGRKKQEDAVNVDIVPSTKPDIVHDLNDAPWPLPDNQFDECHA